MRRENAECLYSTRGFYDYFAEFEYVETKSIRCCGMSKLIILLQNEELKLEWEVEYCVSNCNFLLEWRNITLKSSNVDVRGHFNIFNKIDCNLNSDSKLKLDLKNVSHICCDSNSRPITILFQIFYKVKNDSTSIIDHYQKFLEKKELSDVTFVVEDKKIPAHKVILSAQSDVFQKMFESDMEEKNSGQVKIEGIEFKIFQLLLKFIYCQIIEYDNIDEMIKLMVAADRYSVHLLKDLIGNYVVTKLDLNNVVDILIVADLTNSDYLKKKCLVFINQKKYEVIKTEGYKNMVKSRLTDLLSELYCLPINFGTPETTDKK